MNASRRQKITWGIVAGSTAIAAAALILFLNFDWNRAKPWLNARTSEALDRPFVIDGDLTLDWNKQTPGATGVYSGWRALIPWPHLVARDVRIGNPSGMEKTASEDMARIQQFSFSLNPLALLDKKIAIPVLRFDSPVVSLVRNQDGKNNWTFDREENSSKWKLDLQHVVFTKGSVHLVDAINQADVTASIDTLDTDTRYGVKWALKGKFKGEAVTGNGKAGAVLSLQRQTTPFPIMADLQVGQTKIALEGTLTKPSELAAIDMQLKLSGVSMAKLHSLTGIVLPETPPFSTAGHLTGTLKPKASHWKYEKFSGKVGGSDIAGTLDYQVAQPRSLLSGTISSRLLRFADLAPLVGADSNASKAKRGAAQVQPNAKLLPVEPFKTERWSSIDADIRFTANRIVHSKKLPVKKLTTHLKLRDGVLALMPLDFTIAGGTLRSNITLDGSGKAGKNAIKAEIKTTASRLNLKQLFPTLQTLQASAGEINGSASLSAVGNSVGSLLGASNGEIKLLINDGTVSKLLLEELGLNIGSVLLTHLVGDSQVKLNCMAADFSVTNGLMETRSFVVDTDDAILNVSGNINVAKEQFDLTIKPDSTGLRVFSLRAPIYVQGSFKAPKTSIDKGVLAMKAGGAVALAALSPIAALIPLINTGPREDSQCASLLAAAREKPVSPPPGKTYRKKIKQAKK